MSYPKMLRFTIDICVFTCLVTSAVAYGYGYEDFVVPVIFCGVGLALSIVCHNIHGE